MEGRSLKGGDATELRSVGIGTPRPGVEPRHKRGSFFAIMPAMPAVRDSTGLPLVVRCSEPLAERLGMVPALKARRGLWEAPGLVFWVRCVRPYPLFPASYWWPLEAGAAMVLE